MNRRGFLKGLLGAAAGVAVDPEKLLWTPGECKIFIPPALYAPYKTVYIDSISAVYADGQLIEDWQAYLIKTVAEAFRVPPDMLLVTAVQQTRPIPPRIVVQKNRFTLGEAHEIQNIRRVVGESQGASPLERFRQIEGRSCIQRRS